MFRLHTHLSTVTLALKMRSEGMGIRASGRVLGKSHSNIIRWEKRLAAQAGNGLLRDEVLKSSSGEHLLRNFELVRFPFFQKG